MPTFLLIVPSWRPPLANSCRGRHWSVAHRLRRQTTALLGVYALQQRVPRATGRRRVSVEVVLAPRMRQPDADAFDKLLLDSLVAAGLLVDDGDRGLAGRVEVSFRRGAGTDWGTVIYLTEDPTVSGPRPRPLKEADESALRSRS